jgi:hypothetical protein
MEEIHTAEVGGSSPRKSAACLATQDFDMSSDEATDRMDRPSITTASTAYPARSMDTT